VPDVTLVVVNYFSAALARDAIASARATTSSPLRVIVVDNSCDERELKRLRGSGADDVIVSPDNSGYSGGANRGVEAAATPVVVVSNPDVVYGDGCLDLLAENVRSGAAVAGPLQHWDDEGRWILPPSDYLDGRETLSRVLASRVEAMSRRRGRARLKRRIDFWRRRDAAPADAVSGAVMAIDRRRFADAGGFDTRFELYCEEVDLVRRLRARGGSITYVPRARCRHLYNQSAGDDPNSAAKFAESEKLYLKRWVPVIGTWLHSLRRTVAPGEAGFVEIDASDPIPLPDATRDWLVEATPLLSFESAAGCFAEGDALRFPAEVWSTYRSPALYLRVVNPASLEVVGRYVIRKD
jgi:N-acetylglucosaminyl-diphospho-decaprenol L-rhamnosyltransferase